MRTVLIDDFQAGGPFTGYHYHYFMPNSVNYELVIDDLKVQSAIEASTLALGRLDAFAQMVPDTGLFIKMNVLKEAVTSSRIEGTRTNMEQAMQGPDELGPEERDDWEEVNNYTEAMDYARNRLDTLPFSNRLLRETHLHMMQGVRGAHKMPGEFRRSQNWIGGATLKDAVFIPPHHDHVQDLMSDLELYLNNESLYTPRLVRVAIAHYQFETIHPFLDGNGRLGRLLITLYMISSGLQTRPMLYLSDFFERHKQLYYDNLMGVRTRNDLRQWLLFFLAGVKETADAASEVLMQVLALQKQLDTHELPSLGRRTPLARLLLRYLWEQPVVQVEQVVNRLGVTHKSANSLVDAFVKLNILREKTGRKRRRIFVFEAYLRLFED